MALIQDGGSHGGGNQLYVYRVGGVDRLLKVYRRRGGLVGEWIKGLSHRFFERKRGVSATARRETERLGLEIWRRHGFDVPVLSHDPPPPEFSRFPTLWLEYCPGPSVADVFEEPTTEPARRHELLSSVSERMSRRHELALELGEALLIPEHASIKHVIVFGDRLVQIDLEGGFRPGLPVLEAACQEVSGTLRSVARKAEAEFEGLVDTFVQSYSNSAQLALIAEHGSTGRGTYRTFKRWQDGRRRDHYSKTGMFDAILSRLQRSASAAVDTALGRDPRRLGENDRLPRPAVVDPDLRR
ncbi:MAG: hypothetical protein KDC38_04270 [Planctomycetes bacterium]|nr:hypothetical protein [Planctomycetota bacterium]